MPDRLTSTTIPRETEVERARSAALEIGTYHHRAPLFTVRPSAGRPLDTLVGNLRRIRPTGRNVVEEFLLTVAVQLAIALIDLTIQLMRKKFAARELAPGSGLGPAGSQMT